LKQLADWVSTGQLNFNFNFTRKTRQLVGESETRQAFTYCGGFASSHSSTHALRLREEFEHREMETSPTQHSIRRLILSY
jgi:hypothetical protein